MLAFYAVYVIILVIAASASAAAVVAVVRLSSLCNCNIFQPLFIHLNLAINFKMFTTVFVVVVVDCFINLLLLPVIIK